MTLLRIAAIARRGRRRIRWRRGRGAAAEGETNIPTPRRDSMMPSRSTQLGKEQNECLVVGLMEAFSFWEAQLREVCLNLFIRKGRGGAGVGGWYDAGHGCDAAMCVTDGEVSFG